MANVVKMQPSTIKRNDPVREVFAARTTNGKDIGYYCCKGDAIRAFEDALTAFGYCFANDSCYGWAGDSGRQFCNICAGSGEYGPVVGVALITWYRMPSGRYEFTGYIA